MDNEIPDSAQAGFVHIYHGPGKGKTTAAVGQAVRARGAGMPVAFMQFMKDGTSSEVPMLQALGVQYITAGTHGSAYGGMGISQQEHAVGLCRGARTLVQQEGMVVLDEILNVPLAGGAPFRYRDIAALVRSRNPNTELILTGRECSRQLVMMADYVTRMQQIAHPFTAGAIARPGIEY